MFVKLWNNSPVRHEKLELGETSSAAYALLDKQMTKVVRKSEAAGQL
jgi:hypothetical protein